MRNILEKKVRGAIYNAWQDKGIANVDAVARIAVGAIFTDIEVAFNLLHEATKQDPDDYHECCAFMRRVEDFLKIYQTGKKL